MVIHLTPELEVALYDLARKQGVTPESIVNDALRAMLPQEGAAMRDHDEWQRKLRGLATDCGVSLSHAAVGSEGLYD